MLMTPRALRLPVKIATSIALCGLVCGLFLSPVSAQDPTPTPVPTLGVTPQPTSDPFAPRPAGEWKFSAYQDIVLDYVHMTGPTEGWAICGKAVLTTVNAGLTWREATPPEVYPAYSQVNIYGAFIDAKTAWIIFAIDGKIKQDAVVWSTTDKGVTWRASLPLNHPAYGETIWAEFTTLDAMTIWLTVRGVYDNVGPAYTHALFISKDGGLTWIYLPAETSDNYTGLDFADTGFGLRTYRSTVPYDGIPPAYELTLDGGLNWVKRALPVPPDDPGLFDRYAYCETYQPVALSADSYRMLVGCVDNFDPPEQFEGYFYMTKNDGKTWLFGKLPEKARADTAQLIYFDAKTVYLLGKHSFKSTDDGMKWAYLKVVNWDGQYSFPDPKNGFAIARLYGAVSLVKTTNKAATWKMIAPRIVR